MIYESVARSIDHSLLSPTLTEEELEAGCQLALRYGVASVCIMPYYLRRCAELLRDSGVKASTTVGFPHGGQATKVKMAEAAQALADGGEELDMVVNISQVRSENWRAVGDELRQLVELTHRAGQKLKVIFENCYLEDHHKIRLCQLASEAGADWVKTSTGYGSGGATLEDLKLMRAHAAAHVQVKAAGGIRDLDRLLEVQALQVTRIGASRTADILDECRRRLGLDAV